MMNQPLMISSLIRHADKNHGDTESYGEDCQDGAHRLLQQRAEHQAVKKE